MLTNGIMRIFTDQLNAHIKKQADKKGIPVLWWPSVDGGVNGAKLRYVEKHYGAKYQGKENCIFSQGIIFSWRRSPKYVKRSPSLKEISWHSKYTKYAAGRSTAMTLIPFGGSLPPTGRRDVLLFPKYSANSGTGTRPTAD
jgi:hypothetical protein